MAPSPSNLGNNTAQSTLLASSAIITPSIVIVASAAGIMFLTFLGLIFVIVRRRIHIRRRGRPTSDTVPRLVITDTSRFPASDVVVEGDSDLDKVIASFKPLGADSHAFDEKIGPLEIPRDFVPYEEELDQFVLPRRSRSRFSITSKPGGSWVELDERKIPQSSMHSGQLQSYSSRDITSQADDIEVLEGVWWYDFQGEGLLESSTSLSEAERTDSSTSIYSTSTFESPTLLNISARRSSATISVLDEALGAGCRDENAARRTAKREPTSNPENKKHNTSLDKDILAYCWRLSEDGSAKKRESRTADLEDYHGQAASKSTRTIPSPGRSKAAPMRSIPSSETVDQSILEYCWRLSETSSLKSIDTLSASDSAMARLKKAVRSASDASLSRLRKGSMTGVPPLPSDTRLLNKYGIP